MTTNRKRHLKSEFAPNQTSSTIRQLPLICQMLAKFSGVESERTASKFRIKTKNKKQKTKNNIDGYEMYTKQEAVGEYIWASYTRRARSSFMCLRDV